MPALSSAVLLRLALLSAPLDASALPDCEAGSRHLELMEDSPGGALAVCIHPGLSTSLFFDAKLARVDLPGRERFRVIQDETGLTLVPTRALTPGERVPVTVSFEDGTAPAGARFLLVVHPSEAARQVVVTRQPRSRASHRKGEQQARAEARQCQEEKARLEAECSVQGGLLGLLTQGLLGEGGIANKNITKSVSSRPGNTLTSIKTRSYRMDTARLLGGHKVVRLAVELELPHHIHDNWPKACMRAGTRGSCERFQAQNRRRPSRGARVASRIGWKGCDGRFDG